MAQQAPAPPQQDNKAPVLPTDLERAKLKDKIKIAMHEFEMNVMPFIEVWSNKAYTTPEMFNHIDAKAKTYKLLQQMYNSYEHGCSTK